MKDKKIISVILSVGMLLTSVFVGGVVTVAEETTLTKIVNTLRYGTHV